MGRAHSRRRRGLRRCHSAKVSHHQLGHCEHDSNELITAGVLVFKQWIRLDGGDARLKRLFESIYGASSLIPGDTFVPETQPRGSSIKARELHVRAIYPTMTRVRLMHFLQGRLNAPTSHNLLTLGFRSAGQSLVLRLKSVPGFRKINKREPENQRTQESTKLRINKRAFTNHVIKPRLDGLALALWNLKPSKWLGPAWLIRGLARLGPWPEPGRNIPSHSSESKCPLYLRLLPSGTKML